MEWWPALVFGWPGPILAIGLSAAGVVARRRRWLVAAAVVLVPFAFYLGASPRTRGLFVLPLIPAIGAVGIGRGSAWLGWLSVVTLCVAVLWVAAFVFGAFLL